MSYDDLPEEMKRQLDALPDEIREQILERLADLPDDAAGMIGMGTCPPELAVSTGLALIAAAGEHEGPRHVFREAGQAMAHLAFATVSGEVPSLDGEPLVSLDTLRRTLAAVAEACIITLAATAEEETTPQDAALGMAEALEASHRRGRKSWGQIRADFVAAREKGQAGDTMEADTLAELDALPVWDGPVAG